MDERRTGEFDERPPASPAEALAIIDREQARNEPGFGPYFVVWGVSWLVIGLSWFAAGAGLWSPTAAGIATLVAVVVGVVFSVVLGVRTDRGVQGPSRTYGAMYGVGWMVAMISTGVTAVALLRFVAPELAATAPGAFLPALFVLVAGVVYTVSGALWRSPIDYGLGIALQVVAVATALAPFPWNNLVMAIGGGGALVAVGLARGARR
ncbi:hypothetical protein WIS52_11930 [Pseudonocardia nematodicida]|uniref:Transporter n=1 Tax=Pseudonocardia nematodicida TaxID=1206997 RepID=A0ABV1K9M5_9PSEU